jgi:Dirigent-like protein
MKMSVIRRTPRSTTASLLALVAVGGAALGLSSASAQAPGPRTLTLKELDKGATFLHVRNSKPKSRQANSTGDLIVITNPVVDATGAPLGRSHVTCVTTIGARNFTKSTVTCSGVMALRDGTLTLQGNITLNSQTTTAAVTGGTGAYANARGVLVSRPSGTGTEDTITLVG